MKNEILKKILNRNPFKELVDFNPKYDLKILVTGANGSIGTRLKKRMPNVIVTDIEELDITNEKNVKEFLNNLKPDVIINIAGAKHAPLGEVDIEETLRINTIGVLNLLKNKGNSKLIQCSTCKSANPETVYGASKLISERLVLNNGGVVARFFNVVETSGNVFELWEKQGVIKVASDCNRHFISLDESVGLLMKCIDLPSGRYLVNSPELRNMKDISEICYPNKNKNIIPPRRGDRITEVFLASNENIELYLENKSIIKVSCTHDKNYEN